MIFGRPTNLWIGFITAGVGFVSTTAIVAFHLDPVAVATIAGSATGVLGALVALVAIQPPTVQAGDRVNVHTPNGDPNSSAALVVTKAGSVEVVDRRTG
jgi:hypothetical protein